MAIDVFGLGNTLVDIQTFIDDKLLKKLKINKGIMTLIDEKQSREVLTAIADLRWQVAKEKASYYWMEEGLTGQYYQYIDRQKLKGDLKAFFIEDYVLWMTKEANGVQRLDKEVRGIFWRNMPFPKELKEELRKRSLVYDELCIKDNNRAMSDGY